jgi:ADP-ribosylglycohydrolase
MMLCLSHGLINGKGEFNLQCISDQYKKWIDTDPTDIGVTTKNALSKLVE